MYIDRERSQLVDAASTGSVQRELARQAYDRLGWHDVPAKMRAWHQYQIARIAEVAAEDALFAYDLAHARAMAGRGG